MGSIPARTSASQEGAFWWTIARVQPEMPFEGGQRVLKSISDKVIIRSLPFRMTFSEENRRRWPLSSRRSAGAALRTSISSAIVSKRGTVMVALMRLSAKVNWVGKVASCEAWVTPGKRLRSWACCLREV